MNKKGYKIVSAESFNGKNEDGKFGLELYDLEIEDGLILKVEPFEITFYKDEDDRTEHINSLNDEILDMSKLKKATQFAIISNEDELLIATDDIYKAEEEFLNYIRYTQQEWIDNGERSKEDVDKLISDYRKDFMEISRLNNTLVDYGFNELYFK